MDRFEIAKALREIGLLIETQGGSPFRARAYARGARALESLNADLGPLIDEERLTEIPGIGPALASTISELHHTGRSAQLDRLRRELPPGAHELAQVPGLTLARITALHQALGIASLADLKAAVEAGRVREVKGFGPRLEEKLRAGIEQLQTRGEEVLLHVALAEGERLLQHVRAAPGVTQADLAGPARRRCETVDRLVVTLATADPASAIDHAVRYPAILTTTERTLTGAAGRLASGLRVEAEAAAPEDYAPLLHELTGSEAHRARLAQLATEKGLALDRRGLTDLTTRRRLPVKTEADLYRHLGLPFMPPELREDEGEIEAALAGELPDDLIEQGDVQGMVHCHTVYSDGKHTVEEMARAAEAMGMKYITITDHSPTATYARRPALDRLQRQWEEIARAQEKVKVRLLRGTECDILRRRVARLPRPRAGAARRHHRQHPQPPPHGRGSDDPAAGGRHAPAALQGLGPRAGPLRAAPAAVRLPHGGGARRGRGVARGGGGQRRTPTAWTWSRAGCARRGGAASAS